MVSSPVKASTLHKIPPPNLRSRLSGRREPHLVANFEPVMSAKKINPGRRADNNGAPKKVLVVASSLEANKQADKPG